MKKYLSIFILICGFFPLLSHAIQVKVKSNAKSITALGFTVNGKKYGGLGASYNKNDAPPGTYTFGIRTDKDIACKSKDGKKRVHLKKNTTAFLQVKNNKCTLVLNK